jgi:hypothetical protein
MNQVKVPCPHCQNPLDLQFRVPLLYWCAWCRRHIPGSELPDAEKPESNPNELNSGRVVIEL